MKKEKIEREVKIGDAIIKPHNGRWAAYDVLNVTGKKMVIKGRRSNSKRLTVSVNLMGPHFGFEDDVRRVAFAKTVRIMGL